MDLTVSADQICCWTDVWARRQAIWPRRRVAWLFLLACAAHAHPPAPPVFHLCSTRAAWCWSLRRGCTTALCCCWTSTRCTHPSSRWVGGNGWGGVGAGSTSQCSCKTYTVCGGQTVISQLAGQACLQPLLCSHSTFPSLALLQEYNICFTTVVRPKVRSLSLPPCGWAPAGLPCTGR